MGELYFLLGFIVFWAAVMSFIYSASIVFYDRVWKKIRHRTWVFQAHDAFFLWYNWVYKKQDYSNILHWVVVEKIREDLVTRPHLFKKFMIRTIDDMLTSKEYQRYRYEKLESEE